MAIGSALKYQIEEGVIEVETEGRKITSRVKEKGSFRSGSAILNKEFEPTLAVLRDIIINTAGTVSVEGHTDSVPIKTREFRSNWALSSARAVSVAHGLFEGDQLRPDRFSVKGYAESRPLVANTSGANRSQNRRVEIVISQGLDDDSNAQLQEIRKVDPSLYNTIKAEFNTRFRLSEDEIF